MNVITLFSQKLYYVLGKYYIIGFFYIIGFNKVQPSDHLGLTSAHSGQLKYDLNV